MLKFDAILPPGEVSVLAGASGAGKSTLMVQAWSQWSKGLAFLGVAPARPLRFGYVAADRGVASLLDHARRDKFDIDVKAIVSLIDDTHLDIARLKTDPIGLLYEILRGLRDDGAEILVVDPLMVFLGVDLNRYHAVAPELIMLNRWCKQEGVTLLGIHHTTKARSDFAFLRPQDRISGSSALSGFTSTQWALWSKEELPEEQREAGLSRLDIISHVAAPEVVWLSRGETGLFAQANPVAATLPNLEGRVLSCIPSTDALPTSVLMEHLEGIAARATVYRTLESLVAKGLVEQVSRGLYRRL